MCCVLQIFVIILNLPTIWFFSMELSNKIYQLFLWNYSTSNKRFQFQQAFTNKEKKIVDTFTITLPTTTNIKNRFPLPPILSLIYIRFNVYYRISSLDFCSVCAKHADFCGLFLQCIEVMLFIISCVWFFLNFVTADSGRWEREVRRKMATGDNATKSVMEKLYDYYLWTLSLSGERKNL